MRFPDAPLPAGKQWACAQADAVRAFCYWWWVQGALMCGMGEGGQAKMQKHRNYVFRIMAKMQMQKPGTWFRILAKMQMQNQDVVLIGLLHLSKTRMQKLMQNHVKSCILVKMQTQGILLILHFGQMQKQNAKNDAKCKLKKTIDFTYFGILAREVAA